LNDINVLLYSSENLLDIGIRSLISTDKNLVLTILRACTVTELIETANHLQPDVVIVEQGLLLNHSELLNHLLKGLKDSRVITLDQEHNLLHLYSRQEIFIQQASDLVDVIRSNLHFTQ
jgi:DNA-binding NarL/FixJ family response regulator